MCAWTGKGTSKTDNTAAISASQRDTLLLNVDTLRNIRRPAWRQQDEQRENGKPWNQKVGVAGKPPDVGGPWKLPETSDIECSGAAVDSNPESLFQRCLLSPHPQRSSDSHVNLRKWERDYASHFTGEKIGSELRV